VGGKPVVVCAPFAGPGLWGKKPPPPPICEVPSIVIPKSATAVIPNLGYEPRQLRVREKKLNSGAKRHMRQQCKTRYKPKVVKLIEILGYLFTITTYRFEITATIIITNILLI
jgi:hypothetical protein